MNTDVDASGEAVVRRKTTKEIIGSFFVVYNELGRGFLESVYQNALAVPWMSAAFAIFERRLSTCSSTEHA
jgi:hypothetical protein